MAGVNLAFYVDGSTITGAEAFLLSTFGPNSISTNFCLL